MHRAAHMYCPSAARRAAWLRMASGLAVAVALLMVAWPGPVAAADRIAITEARLAPVPDGDGVALYARFDFEMPQALEDAVNRGIALYFVVDFEMFRNRWYWFDKKVVNRVLTYRLTYSPLTRQYRVARGTLAQPFDTLTEALATIKGVHGWKVIDQGVIGADDDIKDLRAHLRLRLDVSQLPKPFQVNALTDGDWTLTSGWHSLKPTTERVR